MQIWLIRKKTIKISMLIAVIIIALLLAGKSAFNSNVNSFVDPQNDTIVIDPGHGGVDGGATVAGIFEKDINLGISLNLKEYLTQKGYKVILTRERDVALEEFSQENKGVRHIRDLNARVKIINESNAQLFISMHVNCNTRNPQANSAIVYYNEKYTYNKILADNIQNTLNSIRFEGFGRTVHEPGKYNYYILKNTNIPGVIVEAAFLSNKQDRELIMKEGFRSELSRAIAEGIERYFIERKNAQQM